MRLQFEYELFKNEENLRIIVSGKDLRRASPLRADLVRLEGFEPPTYGLEVRCSIQLSYRRLSVR